MAITGNGKMTENSDELAFDNLFVQPLQLQIPVFQREYKWSEKQLYRMFEEINSILDGREDTRFLGAIIAVKRNSTPSRPQAFEVVDGQQRLTTLYLTIIGAAHVLASKNHLEDAIGIINKYIYVDWYEAASNTKMLPSYKDRNQFKSIFNKLLQIGGLSDRYRHKIKLPEASGNETGKMTKQYDRIKKYLELRHEELGMEGFNEIVNVAISKLTFIFILLKDASNATTVFHGLNDPGEPIGIGDLVRNEVFSYVYDNPELANSIYHNSWEPFHRKLGELYDKFFFPYGLVYEPSIKNSNLFKGLRDIWGEIEDPSVIIDKLDEYSTSFLAISSNAIPPSYDVNIKYWLKKLRASNSPSSIFSFSMRLLREYELSNISALEVSNCLKLIEAFLVRRAICGIEPTGLLSVFRFLWNNLGGEITAQKMKEIILNRSTIDWPDDERLKASIISKKIYGASICQYVILEYDISLGGDFPDGQNPWIEHVLPQHMSIAWKEHFTDEDHKDLVNSWGNLIPLSSQMNRELSQSSFSVKKPVIQQESMFYSARKLANDNYTWNKDAITNRSNEISNWAVTRWPK